MNRTIRSLVFISLVTLPFSGMAESPYDETCDSSHVNELNQALQGEAIELKEFLESRKQRSLTGRDRVEACSQWSVLSSYARSMAKHFENSPSTDSAASMIAHLKSELEGNTDCWTNASPQVARMLNEVQIVISRTTRLEALLLSPLTRVNREITSEP